MRSESWKRWLSHLFPIRSRIGTGRFGVLELTWERGRKVVNSPNANQSFGNLHSVWQRLLSRAYLHKAPPGSVLVFGLGAGSVVHILRNEMELTAPIRAIEVDPVMIRWAREHFGLDTFPDLTVVEGDALELIHTLNEQADLVIVDLFIDLDVIPGADDPGFLRALSRSLSSKGTLAFNTIRHDGPSDKLSRNIADGFRSCGMHVDEWHVLEQNVVLVASRPHGNT